MEVGDRQGNAAPQCDGAREPFVGGRITPMLRRGSTAAAPWMVMNDRGDASRISCPPRHSVATLGVRDQSLTLVTRTNPCLCLCTVPAEFRILRDPLILERDDRFGDAFPVGSAA